MASHLKNGSVYSGLQYIGENSGSGKNPRESAYTVPQSSLEAKLHVVINDRHTKQERAKLSGYIQFRSIT